VLLVALAHQQAVPERLVEILGDIAIVNAHNIFIQ
jgi:hypothetical protein